MVLKDVRARLAKIETAMQNKNEHAINEKRQEDLEGKIGFLRRDVNSLLENDSTASRMNDQLRHEFFENANLDVACQHTATVLETP